MATIPEAYHDLFDRETIAHVATLTPAGAPHVTPVWIDYDPDGNRLSVNTEVGRRKERNVRRNPTVGLSMVDPDDPYRSLSVIGTVTEMTTEGATAHIDAMSERYLGEPYPNAIETERVVLCIRPDEVF
ncbi:MAG: TIGR03618 family F420-dependent PPOX class oxidoreductase [Halobacteriales archaeon]